MRRSTNLWMFLAGLVYLVTGVLAFRKEMGAARGWDRLIVWAPVFIAVSLAAFAPEHFRGPEFVGNMVPAWMPARWFWPILWGARSSRWPPALL